MHRETGDLNLMNRSLQDSLGLGRSAAYIIQTNVVGVSSRFGEICEKDMARTIDALAVAGTTSVTELSENVAQVSMVLADSSRHSLPSATSSGHQSLIFLIKLFGNMTSAWSICVSDSMSEVCYTFLVRVTLLFKFWHCQMRRGLSRRSLLLPGILLVRLIFHHDTIRSVTLRYWRWCLV